MIYILVTGGPVHAYLDDVKIITNKFKGGLMAKLADNLYDSYRARSGHDCHGCRMWYLSANGSTMPECLERSIEGGFLSEGITPLYHNGIFDYKKIVEEMAKRCDAIILGAAVANLIPKNKINGKFPSHNYKPGDVIPIDFTIAPRIIDEVKKINPNVHLFGFKLLSGVSHDELISAAYGVLLESKAVTIFANDATDLNTIYAVTKDRSVHKMTRADITMWVKSRMEEKYYKTQQTSTVSMDSCLAEVTKLWEIVDRHKTQFIKTPEGFVFGSVAVRVGKDSFVTTIRGKNELSGAVFVERVDHGERIVVTNGSNLKATLNAPLMSHIFSTRSDVEYILHFHEQNGHYPTREYATPGTDKDSLRDLSKVSFNIENHGCIISLDKKGSVII